MTSHEVIARLVAPTGTNRRRPRRVGEGDSCATNPEHGPMLVNRAEAGREATQRCPHQTHDVTGARASWPADITPEQLVALASNELVTV